MERNRILIQLARRRVDLIQLVLSDQAVRYEVEDTLSHVPVGVLHVPDRMINEQGRLVALYYQSAALKHGLPDDDLRI